MNNSLYFDQERRSTLTPKDSNTSEDEGPKKLVTRTDSMSMEGQGLQVRSNVVD